MDEEEKKEEEKKDADKVSFMQRINRKLLTIKLADRIFFTENLRVMIKAGLSLTESLQTIAMQTESKTFRQVIKEIQGYVESGNSLSESLAKYPKLFPSIFVSMIGAGELSGTMESALEQLTDQMQKDYELVSKIKGALTYPLVIVAATGLIGVGMMIFVIPQILSIFEEIGADQLPLPTKILIGFSNFMTNYWYLAILFTVLFVVGFSYLIKTKSGKYAWHTILLKMWIVGPIIKKINLARFSRTLSSLIRTDIPIVQSLQITREIVGNVHYKAAIDTMQERLKKGDTISSVLKESPHLFPPLIVQMTAVGERAGTTDEMLTEISEFYEAQVSAVMNNMSSIIEPVLILFLGGAVGGIALAIITPIYALTTKFGQ